jgi:hypothetical protein
MKHGNNFSYLIYFILLIAFSSNADEELAVLTEELKEGAWKGMCTNESGSRRYKVKYHVSYIVEEEKKILQIEMVNLDLEPRPDFTYQLIDIDVKSETISFKIPRKHDMKSCELTKQEDSSYKGECHSDKAKNGRISQISMVQLLEEI